MDKKELTNGDQLLLKQAIRDTLGVEFNINRQGGYYYLRLRSRDVSTFCEGVRPYIKDSFSYKIRMLDPFNKGCDIV